MAENAFTPEWAERQRQKVAGAARIGAQATIASPTMKRSKYRNKPVLVDLGPSGETVGGKLQLVHTFDSAREAEYYATLKLRRAAGEISELELQKSYALVVQSKCGDGRIMGYYEADFAFYDMYDAGGWRVIDVKGMKTQVYALKKKIVEACWGITIEEV